MDTYYSLGDKRAFIEEDFRKMVLNPLGKLPSDVNGAIHWCRKAREIATIWFTKYEDVQDGDYANELIYDFILSIEADAKKYFPEGYIV